MDSQIGASGHDADTAKRTRRRANDCQLPDIQAHHEQRAGPNAPKNLGEIVI
jgi:hypothetical protein